jgi:hypothetical protein
MKKIILFFNLIAISGFAIAQAPTGGTITTSGGYTIHTFTTSGTFTLASSLNVEVLVVSGGGGGGGQVGGGGGGGGLIYNAAYAITAGTINIVVGAGGNGGAIASSYGQQSGSNGANSEFGSLIAIGGGGGGGYDNTVGARIGGSGGGGGATGNITLTAGASGTAGQGNAGGNGFNNNWGGGGGGGYGASGANSPGGAGGNGGIGFSSNISGTTTYYAGGGGGCAEGGGSVGLGGLGGGANGGNNNSNSRVQDGLVNTGGGGGGARDFDKNGVFNTQAGSVGAGKGGSGIVIVRYLNSTLPVNLINYQAKTQNNKEVLLSWSTASEQNNDGFELLKSTDGINFSKIALIKGNGNSTSTRQYSFVDASPAKGTNYYKLVQVDFDGAKTELGIKAVNFGFTENSQISVYPNPAANVLNIEFEANNYNNLTILDLAGKVIIKKEIAKIDTKISLKIEEFPASSYLIKLQGESGTIVKQFVKQ